MNNYHEIDLATWKRKELFEFYKKFDAPCFNISAKVEAQELYLYAKKHKKSFFLLSLYGILQAANKIPQMRQRFMDDKIVEFEKIAAMTPIMGQEEMFHQVWCEYFDSFMEFEAVNLPKIEMAKSENPLPMDGQREDFICASCNPWLHFDSMTQAEFFFSQPVPILAWGKLENGLIPVSVKISHCFVDGLHVSKFFNEIKSLFANPKFLEENR